MSKSLVDKVWAAEKGRLEAALSAFGPVDDVSYEEYALMVELKAGVTLTVTLAEEKCREGEGPGLAWASTAVEDGGQVVGECTPYNYGPDLWTVDEGELARRLDWILEGWRVYQREE